MKKRILIAPLNWGLGHATRCIPIINKLIEKNFEPIIASDGDALLLLKKEFPKLLHLELPSYNITYPKSPKRFHWHFLKRSPQLFRTFRKERKLIAKIIKSHNIDGIISDNRFGVYSKLVPSVYITHQLTILNGSLSWLSSKLHSRIIEQYDECWVPDFKENPLSGKLSHSRSLKTKLKYIGTLSRLQKEALDMEYPVTMLLSGPEPQRTYLETILLKTFENYSKKMLLVRGVVEQEQTITSHKNISIYNFLTSHQLQSVLNKSEFIISRSGYTTIMDLAQLNKKAFFIPTPGQYEQEYLASHLEKQHIAPFCSQENFKIDLLEKMNQYSGFRENKEQPLDDDLFSLF